VTGPASVSFGREVVDAVVLADTQTRNDADPQTVHLTAQSTTGTAFVTVEDSTKDIEKIRTFGEVVGYAAFDIGSVRGTRTGDGMLVTAAQLSAAQQLAAQIAAMAYTGIGQAGSVLVNVMSSADLQTPIRVNYAAPIRDAVIMLTGENSLSRYTVRVVAQDDTGFSFIVENWTNQFGFSLSTKVQWIALSAGSYELEDGLRLEVGRVSATGTSGAAQFATAFAAAPVVITTTQTRNDTRAVDSSPMSITATGFEARLQSDVAGVTRPPETVGYFALSQGGTSTSNGFADVVSSMGSNTQLWTPPFDLSDRVILIDTQTRNSTSTVVAKYSLMSPWLNLHLETTMSSWPAIEKIGIVAFKTGTIKARKL